MLRRQCFFVSALSTLSVALFASDGRTEGVSTGDPASARGVPALFAWADVDGDGRLDLAAVSGDGRLQLLVSAGEGRFEDVTQRLGLSGVTNAALALWGDYDNDGRLDLFVGVRAGASLLFHNEGGAFVDMSAASGLASEGAVRSAQWLDHDGDGRLDLFVVTAARDELYRGLEGGFFELAELPLADSASSPVLVGSPVELEDGAGVGASPSADPTDEGPRQSSSGSDRRSLGGPAVAGGAIPLGPTPSAGGVTPVIIPSACSNSIKDQANPSTCLGASTTPTLGSLYPISTNLFVAVSGDVGIGTTTPGARLEVAGSARITDTLTLAPSGDQALDVSTGSIYKGGFLFLHTKGGAFNTALGRDALSSVTTGFANTATGYAALRSDTTGFDNTASGYEALLYNTTGSFNTASGFRALEFNTTGSYNTASGFRALESNTTGFGNTASGGFALKANTMGIANTANGFGTLPFNTTGYFNTADGTNALFYNTTGGDNTAIGFQALLYNTTGSYNTASGVYALKSNTIGSYNTASGFFSLKYNTTGSSNTAVGMYALDSNTTGAFNIAVGKNAGGFLTTGNSNIAIGNGGVAAESATIRIGTAGTQTRAFVAGIRGVTTANANAIPVLVDSAGQLGTVSSSRRFKEEIEDMGDRTERLLALRPVVFRYKPEVQSGERPLEYGLIAEEVAEVFPELVVYDEEGKPFTVKYHLLSGMLLNELKRLHERFDAQCEKEQGLERRLAAVEVHFSPAAPSEVALGGAGYRCSTNPLFVAPSRQASTSSGVTVPK